MIQIKTWEAADDDDVDGNGRVEFIHCVPVYARVRRVWACVCVKLTANEKS